jgi:malate dehydrogenase
VAGLAESCARACPNAVVAIISNPVNSTVPIAVEIYKKAGVANPEKKIVGVTTLDVLRANTFVAEARGLDVGKVSVPVVGGHAGITILPLLSQATPKVSFSDAEADAMTKKIQEAGTVVVEKKEGKGSATLSMAQAASVFAEAVLAGLEGEKREECAYVISSATDLPYFATRVRFGKSGVEEVHPVGALNEFEKKAMEALKPMLKDNIDKGVEFARAYKGKAVAA